MALPEFESESQRPERHRIDQATPLGLIEVEGYHLEKLDASEIKFTVKGRHIIKFILNHYENL